jgi:amino acid transporter
MAGWINAIQAHSTLALAVVVGVAVFAYFRPKEMFKVVGALAIIAAIAYVLSFLMNLTSTGIDETSKFVDRPSSKTNQ